MAVILMLIRAVYKKEHFKYGKGWACLHLYLRQEDYLKIIVALDVPAVSMNEQNEALLQEHVYNCSDQAFNAGDKGVTLTAPEDRVLHHGLIYE